MLLHMDLFDILYWKIILKLNELKRADVMLVKVHHMNHERYGSYFRKRLCEAISSPSETESIFLYLAIC